MLLDSVKKIFYAVLLAMTPLAAAYTVKDGKVMHLEEVATLSVQEHHSLLLEAVKDGKWEEVVRQATIVTKNFPGTPFFQESFYFLGLAYFQEEEFEKSNKYLTDYLRKQAALQHFRDAIELKFQIAEKFREGHRRHIGGYEFLPKWISAKDEAIKIYDEVIQALPNDDLAALSLYGKGVLQLEEDEFTASVETYQTLIRKFPKHSLSPDAYLGIMRVYLVQSKETYPDADYLDLAEINLRKFRQDFPLDHRLEEAEEVFGQIQEVFAQSFYEIAQFYERTRKPHASVLYYSKIIKAFPNSESAALSKARLEVLSPVNKDKETNDSKTETPLPILEPVAPIH